MPPLGWGFSRRVADDIGDPGALVYVSTKPNEAISHVLFRRAETWGAVTILGSEAGREVPFDFSDENIARNMVLGSGLDVCEDPPITVP